MLERESCRSGSMPFKSQRLPTRIMKNSSRLLVKMLANLSRSSMGTLSSAASARTRSLKASQLSSRFCVYMCALIRGYLSIQVC